MDNPPQFPNFSKLPVELRNQIWTWVCFHPRNIDLETKEVDYYLTLPPAAQVRYKSRTPAPSILHTCRESRKIGLVNYSLSFGTVVETTHKYLTINYRIPPRVYVNHDCDLVRPLFCIKAFGDRVLEAKSWKMLIDHNIKRVALPTCFFDTGMVGDPFWTELDVAEVLIYWVEVESDRGFKPLPESEEEVGMPSDFVSLEEDIDDKLSLLEAPSNAKSQLLYAQNVAKDLFPDSTIKIAFRMTEKVKRRIIRKERLTNAILGFCHSNPNA